MYATLTFITDVFHHGTKQNTSVERLVSRSQTN